MQSLNYWKRFEYDGQPIYVNPQKPDWFVPSRKAEMLLQSIDQKDRKSLCHDTGDDVLERAQLLSLINTGKSIAYGGRKNSLTLAKLKECWFHLTDACNLACRHCLFSASPGKSRSLTRLELENAISEAGRLGCTLFYFTGGEPFVYPDFADIVADLLVDPAVHVVVLTNGLLIEEKVHLLQKLPTDRFHLQISLDGMESSHDALRGKGTFKKLVTNLDILKREGFSVTLSVAVNRENIEDLSQIVEFAAARQVRNIHLLWHFVRGKGNDGQFVSPAEIWSHLEPVLALATEKGVAIDNLETIRSQVFSTPGTRYDLSNSGWESIAIGPDGNVYPSPALVGVEPLLCGSLHQGLEDVWRNSPVLREVREATLSGSKCEENAFKFLVGGGDLDHSYIAFGQFVGHDPYVELYNNMALWLIAQQARLYPEREGASFLLKMGDVRFDCPDGQEVALTHCNCVISLSDDHGHSSVREFYGRAATLANEDIVNPFAPDQALADFIPAVSRKRSYGCGSPVHDAKVKEGEVLVDLGSGSGVECFLAAEMVGATGQVYGIDMTDEMLALATSSQGEVKKRLGFDNVSFKKGFLEAIPLADDCANVVISNCVINLSPDKRRTLHEAFRILAPGGRLVVSDIVTDEAVPVHIKNDETLRGECLGGAMQQEELIAMLRAVGFSGMKLVKRFPYRQIGETSFYSLTFAAYKPASVQTVEVIYRGPFAAVYTESGILLLKGKKMRLSLADAHALDDSVFLIDDTGAVTNISQSSNCCGLPPEKQDTAGQSCCPSSPSEFGVDTTAALKNKAKKDEPRSKTDCMVCGGELRYFTKERNLDCYYCGEEKNANATCHSGHFVCDACHQDKGLAQIKKLCTEAAIEDMVTLMKKIRSKPAIAMHGPEHHAMVPGIILATYRARGGKVGKKDILTAIERGSRVPGGVCGFWGSCGAAVGVGIAFSVILEATPLTPKNRQLAQGVTAQVLERIADLKAGRCCQRETLIALQETAKLSKEILPVSLLAADSVACRQYHLNRECIRAACPLWESRDTNVAAGQPLALVI